PHYPNPPRDVVGHQTTRGSQLKEPRVSLLVPGRRGQFGRDGPGDGGVGPDFGKSRRDDALPGIEVRHQSSALAHHDPDLMTGQALRAAIPLAANCHRVVADLQRLPDPDGGNSVSVVVMGTLLKRTAPFAHRLTR